MKAYKGFKEDLTCLGYQFKEDKLHTTDEANCRSNGFHCAENPLDCLTYYSNWRNSKFYEVEALGDIDEDGDDSKIACTQLRLIRPLTILQLIYESVLYMVQYPLREVHRLVDAEKGRVGAGFVIVRGKYPIAAGKKGDIVALLKESDQSKEITDIALYKVDADKYKADIWYDVFGNTVEVQSYEETTIRDEAA